MKTSFNFGKYTFTNYTVLSKNELELILTERNRHEVRKWMNNSAKIGIEEHFQFVDSLKNTSNRFYWLVFRKDIPIGSLYITDIKNQKGTWGYYLFEKYQGLGWGVDIEYYGLYIFFKELQLTELLCFVNKNNSNSLAIQSIFNFKIMEETINQVVLKLDLNSYKELPENILEFKMKKILNNNGKA